MAEIAAENFKEIAFYYPGPMWHPDDWIKTMILFFDGVGILPPGKPERKYPAIAIPLREQGLLHILEPEAIVDKAATEKLAGAMAEVIDTGAPDELDHKTEFHEISYSRMRGFGEESLARQLLESLKAKGPARDSEDGKSIPMQPMVRSLILVLLSQIPRPHGEKLGGTLTGNGSAATGSCSTRLLFRTASRIMDVGCTRLFCGDFIACMSTGSLQCS